MANKQCPVCKSFSIQTQKVLLKKGDKATAVLGVTAAVGVAALTAMAAPVVAPVVAVLGAKGVERVCHHTAHRAAEAGVSKYRITHTCKNCGHKWTE